jgi:general stress protein 26
MADTNPAAKLRDLIKDIRVGMLTTTDDDGSLRSRPMYAQRVEGDERLWFFTQATSPKVDEAERDHHVNVAFSDPSKQHYVSVSGVARLVRDPAKLRELWSEPVRTWFPKGLDDPQLALLCVTPTKGEYWDSHSSAMLHLFGYVKAVVTGKPPKGGENKKVDL